MKLDLSKCWVLDLEGDNLYDDITKIWCIVVKNALTGEVVELTSYKEMVLFIEQNQVTWVGHNIVGFDKRVVEKLLGTTLTTCIDTMLLSMILHPERNAHSLDSYSDDKVQNDVWDHYNPVILERCISDVDITLELFLSQLKELESWNCPNYNWVDMEHSVAEEVSLQAVRGCPINVPKLNEYVSTLETTLADMQLTVSEILGSYIVKGATVKNPFTKLGKLNATLLKWSGEDYAQLIEAPFTKVDFEQVRMSQHARVKDKLLELGWSPSEFTEKGSPKLPKGEEWDDVAEYTGSPDLAAMALFGSLKNRYDILSGWQSKIRPDNRITHGAFTCGTPTARFRHQTIVNIPRPSSVYGTEMRSLIYCDKEDYVQVGWDLAGIELRMLAHFMNDKEFIELVADPDGDIHTFFWSKVKEYVATRDNWKNVFYGYSYGAGNGKLGQLCTALPVDARTAKAGQVLRDAIETSTPSLGRLVAKAQKASLRGYLMGLDGRRVYMKTSKSGRKVKIGSSWVANPRGVVTKDALNRLLQSGAAIVFKYATMLINNRCKSLGLREESLIYYHDEGQHFVHKDDVDVFKQVVNQAVKEAGEHFKLRIGLDCDIKVGANWSDCH